MQEQEINLNKVRLENISQISYKNQVLDLEKELKKMQVQKQNEQIRRRSQSGEDFKEQFLQKFSQMFEVSLQKEHPSIDDILQLIKEGFD